MAIRAPAGISEDCVAVFDAWVALSRIDRPSDRLKRSKIALRRLLTENHCKVVLDPKTRTFRLKPAARDTSE